MGKKLAELTTKIIISLVLISCISCSPEAREWDLPAGYLKVTPSDREISVTLEGYPPFSAEIYSNPNLEGVAVQQLTNISSFSLAFTGLSNGTPYYLRVKSAYGEWVNYCFNRTGNLREIIPVDSSFQKGDYRNPHIIDSPEDLIALSTDKSLWAANTYFVLTKDIDLTGIKWKPIGNISEPFYGNFNGGGHIISGFEALDTHESKPSAGFFGCIGGSSCTIRNLGLKLKTLQCGNEIEFFGGMVGCCEDIAGTLINIISCRVTGEKIIGSSSTGYIGGLIGRANCYIQSCYSDICVEGKQITGGLVGSNLDNGNFIANCYAKGDVIYSGTGTHNVGGFIGNWGSFNASFIENCIALNEKVINAPGSKGTIRYFGFDQNGTVFSYTNYFNKAVFSPEGTEKNHPAYSSLPINPYTINKNTNPFVHWDFSGTNQYWKWDDTVNRPVLRKVKQ